MAFKKQYKNQSYGLGSPLITMAPVPIVSQRAPTNGDIAEIGTIWIDQPNDDSYILTTVAAGVASWINAGGGTGTFNALTVTTTATIGTTLTVTGNTTLNTGIGVVQSSAAGLLTSSAGTDGQLLIGAGAAAAPVWATITAGAGINVTNGAGTITIAAPGATAVQYTCDDANIVVPDGAGNVIVVGGVNCGSVGAVANTITINVDAAPTFAGLVTCQLGIDVSGADATITSATNTGDDIYLHANGGVAETIHLQSSLGTGVDSIELQTLVGGITLTSGLASDDAINIYAVGGGVDVDSDMQLNINSNENATDAISVTAPNGGIYINSGGAAGEDIDINATSSINLVSSENAAQALYLHTNGGVAETIDIHADQGTNAASIYLHSDVGGLTIDTGLNTADSVNIDANSAAAGGFDLDAGTGGIICDTTGAVSLDGALTSNFTVTGASEDLQLYAVGGSVLIDGSEAVATAVSIDASDGAGGVTIAAGTGGLLFGNQVDCTTIDLGDIAPTADRTITVGGGTVVTAAVTDTIDIGPDGATTNANSIKTVNINTGGVTLGEVLTHIATGAITSGTHTVNIQSGNAAAGTVATNISTGTGTKTVNIGNSDGLTTFNLDGITLINDSINVNTSINTGASTGAVAIGNAAAGAMTIDTAAGISLDAVTASNFTVTGAADLTLQSTLGGVDLISGLAAADAIVINASDAAGGVDLDCGSAGFIATIANGPLTVTTGTGQVDISADATANTVNIGTGAGIKNVTVGSTNTSSITAIECGTLGLTLGTSANEHTTQIGSNVTASAVTIVSGTGIAAFAANATDHTTVVGSVTGTSATTLQGGTGALNVTSTSGTITMNAGVGTINVSNDASDATLNIGTGGAVKDVILGSTNTTSSVLIQSGSGDVSVTSTDDITLGATGDLSLDAAQIDINATGGDVSATVATATVAGVALTNSARIGQSTFTGQGTASAASQVFTITNTFVTTTNTVFVSASNGGTNDAQMTITRVEQLAGSIEVTLTNSGAAALNGSVYISIWVMN